MVSVVLLLRGRRCGAGLFSLVSVKGDDENFSAKKVAQEDDSFSQGCAGSAIQYRPIHKILTNMI